MEKYTEQSDITLQTQSLTLEILSMKYIQEIFKEFTDEVTKTLRASTPKAIEEEEERVRRSAEKFKQGTDVNFNVSDKEGKFIWCCGIMHLNTKTPEVGLRLKQSARGKGYGKEMIGALIKRLQEYKDFDYIIYRAKVDNIATRKIAEHFWGILQVDEQGKEKIFIEEKFDKSSSFDAVEYRIYRK